MTTQFVKIIFILHTGKKEIGKSLRLLFGWFNQNQKCNIAFFVSISNVNGIDFVLRIFSCTFVNLN